MHRHPIVAHVALHRVGLATVEQMLETLNGAELGGRVQRRGAVLGAYVAQTAGVE